MIYSLSLLSSFNSFTCFSSLDLSLCIVSKSTDLM